MATDMEQLFIMMGKTLPLFGAMQTLVNTLRSDSANITEA